MSLYYDLQTVSSGEILFIFPFAGLRALMKGRELRKNGREELNGALKLLDFPAGEIIQVIQACCG